MLLCLFALLHMSGVFVVVQDGQGGRLSGHVPSCHYRQVLRLIPGAFVSCQTPVHPCKAFQTTWLQRLVCSGRFVCALSAAVSCETGKAAVVGVAIPAFSCPSLDPTNMHFRLTFVCKSA